MVSNKVLYVLIALLLASTAIACVLVYHYSKRTFVAENALSERTEQLLTAYSKHDEYITYLEEQTARIDALAVAFKELQEKQNEDTERMAVAVGEVPDAAYPAAVTDILREAAARAGNPKSATTTASGPQKPGERTNASSSTNVPISSKVRSSGSTGAGKG